ncbi:MAG TPA: M28 family peptidase [Gemmatimonadaceae bacterium]|jgi:Zn-dependent M28 family amino/carboxypeptidase|nr:M28 family peptidase [Gemmatimonadaceae bacterium]
MNASRIARALLLAAPLVASLTSAAPLAAQGAAPHAEAITASRMRADLMYLAGDGFRGRLTDTPENALALEWIKARFEWLGLAPRGSGGSYFAPYNLITSTLGTTNELAVDWGTATSRHVVGGDFHPRFHSATARASGAVAFVGFGISAPALQHDDLAGDVRGKILLMLDNEPGVNDPASPFDGVVNSEYANQLRKTLAAQARGAAGVLFVADVHNRQGEEDFDGATRAYWPATPMRLPRYTLASWMQQVHIPAGQISMALAEQLVKGTGKSLVTLARAAESSHAPLVLPGVSVTITTALQRTVVPDRNVVAMLEGSDPVLKDEYVLIAAHPDHNGADGAQIFNGADDNGSGTVGLLAIADAYARAAAQGIRPKRSILFVALNSEERGPLMGAWGYVEAPVVPLARTVAMLNMDMIGRNEEIPPNGGARFRGLPVQSADANRNSVNLYGFSRSNTLTAAIERSNAAIKLTLEKRYDNNISQLLRRTDMWAFQQSGVPAVTFATGLHPDYHRVEDRPERIEYDKMERIVRLVHQASWDLANAPDRPALNKR